MVNTNRLDPYQKLNENDSTLNECFSIIKQLIHSVLCDSFNTQSVMEYLDQLGSTTRYMNKPNENINYHLIENIVVYITRLINIFGLNSSLSSDDYLEYIRPTEQQTSTFNVEDIAMPYVEQSPLLRDAERTDAIAVNNENILPLCDHAINEILPESGVRFENQSNKLNFLEQLIFFFLCIIAVTNKTTIKFGDPEVLKRER